MGEKPHTLRPPPLPLLPPSRPREKLRGKRTDLPFRSSEAAADSPRVEKSLFRPGAAGEKSLPIREPKGGGRPRAKRSGQPWEREGQAGPPTTRPASGEGGLQQPATRAPADGRLGFGSAMLPLLWLLRTAGGCPDMLLSAGSRGVGWGGLEAAAAALCAWVAGLALGSDSSGKAALPHLAAGRPGSVCGGGGCCSPPPAPPVASPSSAPPSPLPPPLPSALCERRGGRGAAGSRPAEFVRAPGRLFSRAPVPGTRNSAPPSTALGKRGKTPRRPRQTPRSLPRSLPRRPAENRNYHKAPRPAPRQAVKTPAAAAAARHETAPVARSPPPPLGPGAVARAPLRLVRGQSASSPSPPGWFSCRSFAAPSRNAAGVTRNPLPPAAPQAGSPFRGGSRQHDREARSPLLWPRRARRPVSRGLFSLREFSLCPPSTSSSQVSLKSPPPFLCPSPLSVPLSSTDCPAEKRLPSPHLGKTSQPPTLLARPRKDAGGGGPTCMLPLSRAAAGGGLSFVFVPLVGCRGEEGVFLRPVGPWRHSL
ncbi:translation initiation factor IF-2-like [Sphaerodactylus townsendi]|uniref:translation initiation factor IF-2-like n=1 Tax=Sphaerodactylus townsendi TaxID=933632 RepID=UPI002025BF0D|nr:translation initiation factor IF-2-like [Sphaerodactylus townsendi]